MFQSLRPNNQIYILRKDKPSLEIGSVVSVSLPTPKYQMQPPYSHQQEMVVDIIAKVNNQDVTYQKIPANLDIADFGSGGIVLSDNREAMNAEILSLKNKSINIINSVDYHKEVIANCEGILSELNPEFAEKQAQQKEINELKTQMEEMTKNITSLMIANQQLIQVINNKETNHENVGN